MGLLSTLASSALSAIAKSRSSSGSSSGRSSITPTSYNGVSGTWNNYGEFTPSSTPWLPKPYGGDSGTVTSSTISPYSSKTTAAKYGGYNTTTPPTYDYSTPNVVLPTWEEAMGQAKAYFEPQYKSAVLSQNKLASDQQKRLTQALAARGYANARGGHRQVGEEDISQQHAMALENLRNQYDSLIGKRAMEIYSGEGNDAYNKLRTLLADRDARNLLALQQYGLDLNAGLQRDQMRENSWNSRQNAIWDLAKLLAELEE